MTYTNTHSFTTIANLADDLGASVAIFPV
jgi:hypothetical protein